MRLLRQCCLIGVVAGAAGCYSARAVTFGTVERADSERVYRIVQSDGEVIRARIEPGSLVGGTIACHPCVYAADSWEVRYSGWPAVYSAGKYWRRETYPETMHIPLADIDQVLEERIDWPLTLLAFPFQLPLGLVDFVVRNAQLGFERVTGNGEVFSSTER